VSAFAFVISWGNAPFAIAMGVVGVFALLQATGLLGLLAGDGDAEHDVDHDVDADHDADGDHDGDGGDRGWVNAFFGALGVGTIPLSMIWQTFALVFGAVGFACNLRYFGQSGGPPILSLAWTAPAGMVSGFFAVSAVTRFLGPVLSSKGQEATSRAQLVGQIGVVISSKVDHDFGEVRIRDKSGHDLRVVCKLTKGARIAPTEQQSVVVVDCDDQGALLVAPIDDEPAHERRREE
jgi:hypothetical protein